MAGPFTQEEGDHDMQNAQLALPLPAPSSPPAVAAGEKAKARDILAAIRTLKQIEQEQRPATRPGEAGPGPLRRFRPRRPFDLPRPRQRQLQRRLLAGRRRGTPIAADADEYASAKRTTFNAFYTSSTVIRAMYQALARLGVPDDGQVLEPGCGPGDFLPRPKGDAVHRRRAGRVSGRIAKALHPGQDIRIENFRDTQAARKLDAVIGNVPFADVKLEHRGQRFSLHDYFFAKSADALNPGGVLALVTSHYTLDKQNASLREQLADQADFSGRSACPPTPSSARAPRRHGHRVPPQARPRPAAAHADPEWLPSRRWPSRGWKSRSTAIS